jgi:BioD-like phosphotransacetylase family protein
MIEAATKAGVPLILVEEDTFAALERLEQSPSVLSSRDEVKIRRFSEMLDRENALDLLISRLRLPTLQRRENGESERGRG